MAYLESVDNALRVLLLLSDGRSVTVTSLAAELGVAPSTAHRLLATLVHRQFVVQGPDRSYAAGPAMLRMGAGQHSRASLLSLARPYLREVSRALDETCHIGLLVGRSTHFLMSEEAGHTLRIGIRDGQIMPAHLTAGGKVLLARLPPDRFAELYPAAGVPEEELDAAAVALLAEEVEGVRRRGYALNKGATERGLYALGVPIVGEGGVAVGSLTVSMPSVRWVTGRVPDLVAQLRAGADRIAAGISAH